MLITSSFAIVPSTGDTRPGTTPISMPASSISANMRSTDFSRTDAGRLMPMPAAMRAVRSRSAYITMSRKPMSGGRRRKSMMRMGARCRLPLTLVNLQIEVLHLLLQLGIFSRHRFPEVRGSHAWSGLAAIGLEPLRYLRRVHAVAHHAVDPSHDRARRPGRRPQAITIGDLEAGEPLLGDRRKIR